MRETHDTTALLDRVVCGVDGSAEGFAALGQVLALRPDGSRLVALTVIETALALRAGLEAPVWTDRLRAEGAETRDGAERRLVGHPGTESRLVEGHAADALLSVARKEDATLIAVGAHSHSRAAGIVLGSVATRLVHDAPCAVLLAREAPQDVRFPRSVVAGVDGSADSLDALAAAREIGRRTGARLRALTALGGKPLHGPAAAIDGLETDERDSVGALVGAAGPGDLLVVGSRGLHGVAALGSVSERVAHASAASVLVVRRRG